MRRYLVKCEFSGRRDPEHFLCEGDDTEHAREQAKEAYPATLMQEVFELVPADDYDEDLREPKAKQIIAWLNLTSVEWSRIPSSVKVKMWDGLVSKRST